MRLLFLLRLHEFAQFLQGHCNCFMALFLLVEAVWILMPQLNFAIPEWKEFFDTELVGNDSCHFSFALPGTVCACPVFAQVLEMPVKSG